MPPLNVLHRLPLILYRLLLQLQKMNRLRQVGQLRQHLADQWLPRPQLRWNPLQLRRRRLQLRQSLLRPLLPQSPQLQLLQRLRLPLRLPQLLQLPRLPLQLLRLQ